jgi:hypothetical protein
MFGFEEEIDPEYVRCEQKEVTKNEFTANVVIALD